MSSPLKNVIAVAALAAAASCTTQADGPEDVVTIDVEAAALYSGYVDLGVPTSGQLNGASPYDYYYLETQAGQSAQIDASSPSGDDLALIAYKYVYSRRARAYRFVEIDRNDDCGFELGATDPCLFLDLDGSYYAVLVTTAEYLETGNAPAASYELTVAQPCGGSGNSLECADDQYCDFPDDQCSAADVPGVCIQRPEVCTREYVPVCACGTDEVFSNECTAAAAGFDVVACPAQVCSSNAECGTGQVCDLSSNTTCGPDIAGTCRDIDVYGFCPAVYMPVCGCDGKTYGNECERIASGAALAFEGECEPACDPELICGQAFTCVDGDLYPTTCGPANCDEPVGPCEEPACDPELICGQAFTCVDGDLYPTTCGPANCDEPVGPCEEPACDPELICGQALTCVDGDLYPTTCGPANCDEPIGPCEEPACDPELICGQALTCVDGGLYPTTCGPANCDEPIASC